MPEILERLAQYTNRYVIVEFMPLGLWTAKKSKPSPDWYSTEWFQTHFAQYFNLILTEQLADNRLVFVGELKAAV